MTSKDATEFRGDVFLSVRVSMFRFKCSTFGVLILR